MMAFHGGVTAATIGFAVSAGCLRMRDRDVKRPAKLVRAGTPVVVRR
jgi:lipoprotein-anchoring transpeptidase ErfK/SrfK